MGQLASIATAVRPGRRLDDWITSYLKYSENLPSPEIFRKWTAIACIAGALERKVWLQTHAPVYPNLYTVLVAPPGIGKTEATSQVETLWGKLDNHHIAPSSVSKASLMDALYAAKRIIIQPSKTPPTFEFNSLLVNANELGVFLPSWDNEFMSALTDVYDGKPYREQKRGKDLKIKIDRPQLNLLAGTTPGFLTATLPEGAWDQGFMSRVICVYSGESVRRNIFGGLSVDSGLYAEIVTDLKNISEMVGQMKVETGLAEMIQTWYDNGCAPAPTHPKLLNYNSRRLIHCVKLAIIVSASESSDMVVTIKHFEEARDLLIEAEFFMPDIFKAMRVGGDSSAMADCHSYVFMEFTLKGKPCPEFRVLEFLAARLPAHSVDRVLDLMVRAKMLDKEYDFKAGQNMYKGKHPSL